MTFRKTGDESSDQLQMMEVEIKYGKGKIDSILVHFGDDPEELAEEFAASHRLKPSSVGVIAEYIRNAIDEFQDNLKKEEDNFENNYPDDASIESHQKSQFEDQAPINTTKTVVVTETQDIALEAVQASELVTSENISVIEQIHQEIPPLGIAISHEDSKDDTTAYTPKASSVQGKSRNRSITQEDIGRIIEDVSSRPRQSSSSVSFSQSRRNSEFLSAGKYPARSPEYYLSNNYDSVDSFVDESAGNDLKPIVIPPWSVGISESNFSITKDTDSQPNDFYIPEDESGIDNLPEPSPIQNTSNKGSESDEENEAAATFNRLKHLYRMEPSTKLKPVSNTLQMGKNKSVSTAPPKQFSYDKQDPLHRAKFVGQSASDRLYRTAAIKEKKRIALTKKAEEVRKSAEVETLFQVNEMSRRIVENNSHRNKEENVNIRLYKDAISERERKQVQAKRHKEVAEKKVSDWSCAKCGTFHKVTSRSESILKSASCVCKSCGWSQAISESHTPQNIGLVLHDGASDILKSRKANRQEEGGDIYNYLYHTGKQRAEILRFNRQLWEEIQSTMPFAPAIPQNSKDILERCLQECSENGSDDEEEPVALGKVKPMVGLNNRLTGAALKEYLKKPAVERLVATQTRSVVAEAMIRSSANQKKAVAMTEVEKQKFVDRLVNEVKEKEDRQRRREEEAKKVDLTTGHPLFKPQVAPIPEGLINAGIKLESESNSGKRNIWEDIRIKDKEREAKLLLMQRKAVQQTLEDIRANQVKALPQSNEIIKQSTERNLQDLYRLLLASVDEATKSENSKNISVAGSIDANKVHELARAIKDWRDRKLDLMQVNAELMINEVSTLLLDMKKLRYSIWLDSRAASKSEKSASASASASKNADTPENLEVDFEFFQTLAQKCIRMRNGPGKAYIYAPRKKSELVLQMKKAEESEERFRPKIDDNSERLTRERQIAYKHVPIEDILQKDWENSMARIESARREKQDHELDDHPFKPKLYKLPPGVVPRYRNMDILEQSDDSDGEGKLGEELKTGLNLKPDGSISSSHLSAMPASALPATSKLVVNKAAPALDNSSNTLLQSPADARSGRKISISATEGNDTLLTPNDVRMGRFNFVGSGDIAALPVPDATLGAPVPSRNKREMVVRVDVHPIGPPRSISPRTAIAAASRPIHRKTNPNDNYEENEENRKSGDGDSCASSIASINTISTKFTVDGSHGPISSSGYGQKLENRRRGSANSAEFPTQSSAGRGLPVPPPNPSNILTYGKELSSRKKGDASSFHGDQAFKPPPLPAEIDKNTRGERLSEGECSAITISASSDSSHTVKKASSAAVET